MDAEIEEAAKRRLILSRSRKLRCDTTDAEKRLWFRLRNRRFSAHKFRRQQPVGSYIVDFICFEAGLIIELDGGQHAEQVEQDKNRTDYLIGRGYRVIRFWNNDVLSKTQSVLQVILQALETKQT